MEYLKKIARLVYIFNPSTRKYALSQFKTINFIYYYIFFFFNNKKENSSNKKTVLINLNNPLPDRYLFSLLLYFQINNYQLYLKPNFQFLSQLIQAKYLKRAIKTRKLKIALSYKLKDTPDIEIVEDSSKEKNKKKHKTLIISYHKPFDIIDLQMPFPMHPIAYDTIETVKELNCELNRLRESRKNIKIFFAGNFNHPEYEKLNLKFPQLLNRNETFSHIQSKLAEFITNDISVLENKSVFTNKFLILHRRNANFTPKDWLNVLNKSVFFLCPAGYLMPFSHNLIEAMACGVIPILEYGDLFNPPLEHEINCIVFNGKEDLVEKIKCVLQMEKNSISQIQQNVIQYYEHHLSPESLVKEVESKNKKTISIKIIGGQFSFSEEPDSVLL